MNLLIRKARVLTLAGHLGPRRGEALGDLCVLPQTDVLIENGHITQVAGAIVPTGSMQIIEAGGRVLMPGFVDCHTHACWAGERVTEWESMRSGVPYLEILKQGGGIFSTVRAVRLASSGELAGGTLQRLNAMLSEGTTTVEVKSGYGLSTEHELRMLHAIDAAGAQWSGTVVRTALLGHAIEGNVETFVDGVIEETLPEVSRAFPGITIDAFCEVGAWSLEACVRLFQSARLRGHSFRVHADQFNSMGMTSAAVQLGARSVDHLEAATDSDLAELASSKTFGVILPAAGFHTDRRYASVRQFIDSGGALALATNYNPGSAPTHSMPFAIALAVRFCGLTPAEAITATTVNPANLLGLTDRGTIEPGQRADLILLRHRDERMLAYEFGGNPVDVVICRGRIVSG